MFKDISVTLKTLEVGPHKLHRHHFFELIYIMEGEGIHNINKNEYRFTRSDVFLLTPEDMHAFQVTQTCTFCIIDFTSNFLFRSSDRATNNKDVLESYRQLEYIFHNHLDMKGNLREDGEEMIFDILVRQLIREQEVKEQYSEVITQNIAFLLLNFIARNIERDIGLGSENKNPRNRVHEVMVYVQHNIYSSNKIRLKHIASVFRISTDHLNRSFKSQTQYTLKEYVLRYKIELVQTRLKYSDLNIAEIADELNFSDESHLNKVLKKYVGLTARQLRNQFQDI